ncbi:hypothetical protein CWI42_021380 [Ordospora colligata]|uniref:Uncharacterized protein n=1 Tax=Ordospora colligata OC4 TaxID=1354746 RepID=A0A0B2UGX5_9MICR|nr:uncharacterized protein M896_021390 [Ordospora colligata OC4]KHN70301.1 hypothetical protein M896_021390 [Ordospora colligata OC4]TBU16845.1 hypothetical protein CWI41_021400 [Ordospora colligata]TBU19394.1 hypothetical protein CWI42_021380 [Ordospora colligata]
MEIRVGVVRGAVSSCHLKDVKSSVLCMIFLEQKNEVDAQVEVKFSEGVPEHTRLPIRSTIESLFCVKSRSTRIRVVLHVIRSGDDVFCSLINSFSVCVAFSGLGVVDTVCSSMLRVNGTEVEGDNGTWIHVVYMIHKKRIMQVYFEGMVDVERFGNAAEKLVSECDKKGEDLKAKIEQIVEGSVGS